MSPRLWKPERLLPKRPGSGLLVPGHVAERKGKPLSTPELLSAIVEGRPAVVEALRGRDDAHSRTADAVERMRSQEYRAWRKHVIASAARPLEAPMRRTFRGIVPRRTADRLLIAAMAAQAKENA